MKTIGLTRALIANRQKYNKRTTIVYFYGDINSTRNVTNFQSLKMPIMEVGSANGKVTRILSLLNQKAEIMGKFEDKYRRKSYSPAAKWRGVDFLPAVSLAFTVWGLTNFFTLDKSPVLHASNNSLKGSFDEQGRESTGADNSGLLLAIFSHFPTHGPLELMRVYVLMVAQRKIFNGISTAVHDRTTTSY